MKEKIANSIALHQMTINELKEIKHNIEQSVDENVKFTSMQLLFITNPNEMYRDNHTNYTTTKSYRS